MLKDTSITLIFITIRDKVPFGTLIFNIVPHRTLIGQRGEVKRLRLHLYNLKSRE